MNTSKGQSRDRFSWRNLRRRILQSHPKPFSSVLTDWRFLTVLVILLIFTNWLGKRWVLEPATLGSTDILLRQRKPVPAAHCTLITIDEKEFNHYLGEYLQPEQLTSVLKNIIEYAPNVIVVDIDTSAPRFSSMPIPTGAPRIVWAQVAYETLKNNPSDGTRSLVWQAGAVLGKRPDQPEFSGTPLFPQDPDATVRNFQRTVTIDAHAPSLHWASLRAFCESGAQDACSIVKSENAIEDLKLRPFLTDWDFRTIPLSDLMGTGGDTLPHAGGLGEIVLLGANFSDIHPTSFGPRLGIELTAAAIESELAPKLGPWRVYEWSHWILKILLAFAIAWLNNRLLPLWATTGTLLLIGLVFTASFLGIYYGVLRMDFLPFMIGIWIEQLIEISERAHHTAH
jgi:CHASE2 domain-containing sensor protein